MWRVAVAAALSPCGIAAKSTAPASAASNAIASPAVTVQNETAHHKASPRQRPTQSHRSEVPRSATGKSLSTACSGWPKTRKPFAIHAPSSKHVDAHEQYHERGDGEEAVHEHVRDGQCLLLQVHREEVEAAERRAYEAHERNRRGRREAAADERQNERD